MLRNWFYNELSIDELASIYEDAYFEKFDTYPCLGRLGRCSMAALLEELGVVFKPN